jgi:hypothetical protein
MNVAEFVDKIAEILPAEFPAVCKMAKDGKMGWGDSSCDWGTKDGRG